MDIYPSTKICSKCKIEQPINNFHKDKRNKSNHRAKCKTCVNFDQQIYRDNNGSNLEYQKEYRKKNKDKINIQRKQYYYNRRKTDKLYHLRTNIGSLINISIKSRGFKKTSKTQTILGCDWNTFKEHLECQFDENMNWDNYGTYWDIDHIIPVSSSKTEDDIIELNHYTNLQPLERHYNRYIKRHYNE